MFLHQLLPRLHLRPRHPPGEARVWLAMVQVSHRTKIKVKATTAVVQAPTKIPTQVLATNQQLLTTVIIIKTGGSPQTTIPVLLQLLLLLKDRTAPMAATTTRTVTHLPMDETKADTIHPATTTTALLMSIQVLLMLLPPLVVAEAGCRIIPMIIMMIILLLLPNNREESMIKKVTMVGILTILVPLLLMQWVATPLDLYMTINQAAANGIAVVVVVVDTIVPHLHNTEIRHTMAAVAVAITIVTTTTNTNEVAVAAATATVVVTITAAAVAAAANAPVKMPLPMRSPKRVAVAEAVDGRSLLG